MVEDLKASKMVEGLKEKREEDLKGSKMVEDLKASKIMEGLKKKIEEDLKDLKMSEDMKALKMVEGLNEKREDLKGLKMVKGLKEKREDLKGLKMVEDLKASKMGEGLKGKREEDLNGSKTVEDLKASKMVEGLKGKREENLKGSKMVEDLKASKMVEGLKGKSEEDLKGNYLKGETDTKERKRFGMSSLIPLRLLLPPLSPTITLQYPPFQLPSSKSSFKSFSSSYLPCAWNTTSSPSKRRKWLCGHMGRDQDIDNRSTEDKSGMQMFGSDEEIGTQIPTQAQSVVEGSGSVMVSEFRPAADVDYLQELLAIQQQGPRSIGFFGTRNMGFMHQELIEILSYAMVITKNHIYTSGASGTNAAVIRGALRAEKPELLTVILPQSLKKQPPESQELLSKVKNVIEKPHNDHLPLLEASRLCNMDIISHVQQVICFAFHDSKLLMETCQEAKNLRKIVTLFYLD
ncbi:hypothetical protein ACLB2K_009226 [Fragaria x ananassa]